MDPPNPSGAACLRRNPEEGRLAGRAPPAVIRSKKFTTNCINCKKVGKEVI